MSIYRELYFYLFAALADAAAVKGISLRMTESWAGLAAAK